MINEIKKKISRKEKYSNRARYEVNCSVKEFEMISELSKLEGKKRNKVIIELVKKRLEELKEENK